MTQKPQKSAAQLFLPFIRWFDSYAGMSATTSLEKEKDVVDWLRVIPFILLHFIPLAIIWVGISPIAVWACLLFYFIRVFAITGFYHRYFSHRAFKTSRFWQFIFAALGNSAIQRGPLWWAAHHRNHHKTSDAAGDEHSPRLKGFWWSHVLWFLSKKNFATRFHLVKDWQKFPELVFLDRFNVLIPLLSAVAFYGLGEWMKFAHPALGTSGAQLFVWGFALSTVCVYHATFSINSLAHKFGSRRFMTGDDSRNNFFLSLITLGEGWHNNHHHYPSAVRQGFYWWEIDITYYVLKCLEACGIIQNLRRVPNKILHQNLVKQF